MLFPNHSEDELRRVLSEAKFDLDEAISVILAHDNLANALSAEDLVVHDDFDRPQTGAIIGELIKRVKATLLQRFYVYILCFVNQVG